MNKCWIKVLTLGLLMVCTSPNSIEMVTHYSQEYKQAQQQQKLMAALTLLLVKDDEMQVIKPAHQLKSGSKIRLRLSTSVESHYSVYTLTNSNTGIKERLFEGVLSTTHSTLVPPVSAGYFELDDKPGVEWLQIVVKPLTKISAKPKRLFPHGKIEQVILRDIKLLSKKENLVNYDPVSQTIYFSTKAKHHKGKEISLTLGLTHCC